MSWGTLITGTVDGEWQLSSTSGSLSIWKTVCLAGQVNPRPPNTEHTFQTALQRPPLFCCSWAPIKSPPPAILFKWELNFFFFQHVYVIICKSYQKWTMRHKRGTHTQFNEVFTDNSNCQILVPDDIVQSADAHNCLSLSYSLPPR